MLLSPAADGKVLWQAMLRQELLDASARGAVLLVPVGSVEQHGPHLPLNVDIRVPYHLAIRAAVRCADLPVLVTPSVTFGLAHYNSPLKKGRCRGCSRAGSRARLTDPALRPALPSDGASRAYGCRGGSAACFAARWSRTRHGHLPLQIVAGWGASGLSWRPWRHSGH